MSFYTNETMLDTQQLREMLGEDAIPHPKGRRNRTYGDIPSDDGQCMYGVGANLVNWNYDPSSGQAISSTIPIDERCWHPIARLAL